MRLLVIFTVLIIVLLSLTRQSSCKKSKCFGSLCNSSGKMYPSAKIEKLLKKSKQFKIVDNTVISPVNKAEPMFVRSRSAVTETNLCQSIARTKFPKFDKEHNMTIVNSGKYRQGVRFEWCLKEEECLSSPLLNYRTACKQLYNKVRLLYYNNDKLEYRLATVPSACICVYQFDKINKG